MDPRLSHTRAIYILSEEMRRPLSGAHSKQEHEPQRGVNEKLVQIDSVSLGQDFGEADGQWFTPKKLQYSRIQKKKSWCNAIPAAQGSVITSKLDSGYASFLPRRWVLEIGYLY